ncbi:hypothetical protein ACJQWK_01746 [Exserohilum turcicum]
MVEIRRRDIVDRNTLDMELNSGTNLTPPIWHMVQLRLEVNVGNRPRSVLRV